MGAGVVSDTNLDDYFRSLEAPSTAGVRHESQLRAPAQPRRTDGEDYQGERHACFECNGTGKYQGRRVQQEKAHCFACKGKGWFKSSYADRQKKKQQAASRAQAKMDEAKAAFCAANEGLIERLKEIAGWHSFAASMIQNFDKWGSLTDKQVAAAWSSLARVEAKRAERKAAQASRSGEVSVAAIEAIFRTAQENGLKRPKFLTERLQISLAPAHGKNAGALYVVCDGAYAGKIKDGQLHALREAPADILELVRAVAASPLEAARMYGRKTGTCSCCGRELTDPKSIEAGIGPVCETNWGL